MKSDEEAKTDEDADSVSPTTRLTEAVSLLTSQMRTLLNDRKVMEERFSSLETEVRSLRNEIGTPSPTSAFLPPGEKLFSTYEPLLLSLSRQPEMESDCPCPVRTYYPVYPASPPQGQPQGKKEQDSESRDVKVGANKEADYDISQTIIIALPVFIGLLFIAYMITANREALMGAAKKLIAAAKDATIYQYAYFFILLVMSAYFLFAYYRYLNKQRKEIDAAREKEMLVLVDQIVEAVKAAHENGEKSVSIGQIRNQIIPPIDMRYEWSTAFVIMEMTRWDKAVNYINENETRIRKESVTIGGVEVPTWAWVPS